jgi:predicted O-methyltransferase YrrM
LDAVRIPDGLDAVLQQAWDTTSKVPGFLLESEARFLGMAAACTPPSGSVVEIGSFKGKSTIMLATVCKHYGLGPVIAIDPHTFHSSELQDLKSSPTASTYEDFQHHIQTADISDFVDVRRALSSDVSPTWNAPIRFLWIDGDHTYRGAKDDLDGFIRHLIPGGIVAFHDALHEFDGPIRVFAEDILRSDMFGAAGFVGSIAWAQFRPEDGALFKQQRAFLEKKAAALIPYVQSGEKLHGIRKILFKLNRSRVPRSLPDISDWAALLNGSAQT